MFQRLPALESPIVLSCDMTFDEKSYPYKEIRQCAVPFSQPTVLDSPITIKFNMFNDTDKGPAP